MNHKFLLTIIIILLFGNVFGQTLRFRLSANSGMFLSEIGSEELNHPLVGLESNPNSTDFTSDNNLGAEFEIMVPVTLSIEAGIEFAYANFSGYNNLPPMYNFNYNTHFNPIGPAITEALIYETTVISILGNWRFFMAPKNKFNPYLKIFAGISFIGTDYTFKDPFYSVDYGVGVLFARGTLNSEKPKEMAFNYGTGIGIEYQFLSRFAFNVGISASIINSDIIDGRPNFDYLENEALGNFNRANNMALVPQASIGLVYSAIPDKRYNKSNKTKSRRVKSRKTLRNKKSFQFFKRR